MDNKHGDAAMIDPADKQTAYLPLEQPKRGRGRPATGAALTPAQKQKAYRERQKQLLAEAHNLDAISQVQEGLNADAESQIRLLSKLLDEERENSERLANKVIGLERKLKELNKSNVTEKPIKGLNYRKTKDAMLEACKSLKTGDEDLTENWRFGALRMWETITRDMSVSREQRKKDEKIFREMAGLDTE